MQVATVSIDIQGFPRFISSIFGGFPYFFGAFPRIFGRFPEFFGQIDFDI